MHAERSSAKLSRLRIPRKVPRLLILFGDQLDHRSAGLQAIDTGRDGVLMMEVDEEATHVPSHKQRTTLFLSSMRHFALELAAKRHAVHYVSIDDPKNTRNFDGEVERAVQRLRPQRLICVEPGEWRVHQKVARWQDRLGIPVEILGDRHFLTTGAEFESWAEGRTSLRMEHFYREQRRRLGILLTRDGKPVGGKWNFDAENRETFSGAPNPPRPYRPRTDAVTIEVIRSVEKRFPDAPGRLDPFIWPVTRTQARRALDDFIGNRLDRFGPVQDAMWSGEPFLYHSLLSSALNLKLLEPMECVDAAVAAYHDRKASLQSVEGFVRQIIGWREFIRGIYMREGPDYRDGNALDQHGRLPSFYWTADTEMNCMHHALSEVLTNGYGHHIQRLMITGNFALISGVGPREISDWFLAMYVDAVDWVTLPNVLGMAMYADGGLFASKPYAASGRYVSRMSNYCSGCRYDPTLRKGSDACPFNTFYWDFLIRNRERLRGNHRMAMILKNVDRLPEGEQQEIRASAARLRTEFGINGQGGPDRSLTVSSPVK